MPEIMAIADITPDRIRSRTPKGDGVEGGDAGGTHTDFFKSATGSSDDPHAFVVEYTPGGTSSAHYHAVDQFQILVSGEGTFGRHPVSPYSLHFSRAYTAYGPLASPGGWAFLTLRAHSNAKSQRDFEKLRQIPDRHPWQVTSQVAFPQQGREPLLQTIPEIADDRGLLACALTVPPHAELLAPAPAGSLQYVVATKGSLIHEGREYKALAVVLVRPHEQAFRVRAGAEGLEGMVLNFSRASHDAQAPQAGHAVTAGESKVWQCALCAFTYDESQGMPHEGIPAGTRWADVPDTWCCPDCSATKKDFQMVEL